VSDALSSDDIDPLTLLAIRHGTDKWGPHFYTPIYHAVFAHLRDRPVRLLEIGVGGYKLRDVGGASLAMWADYFPHGRSPPSILPRNGSTSGRASKSGAARRTTRRSSRA
jgi:hypothetical protein